METYWTIDGIKHHEEELLAEQGFSSALVIDGSTDYAFIVVIAHSAEQEFLLKLHFGNKAEPYFPIISDSIV
jgi:hypothetical protein